MKKHFVCGIDIGSSHISAVALQRDWRRGFILESAVQKYVSHDFIKCGLITNFAALQDVLSTILWQFESENNGHIVEIFAGIGGKAVEAREAEATIAIGDRKPVIVSASHVRDLLKQMRLLYTHWSDEVLHQVPHYFLIDHDHRVQNPLHLQAYKISVRGLLVVSPRRIVDDFYRLFEAAGWELTRLFFTPLGLSTVFVPEQEKQRGCVYVDIGDQITDLCVFNKGDVGHIKNFPFGSSTVSAMIAENLDVDYEVADRFKKEHICAKGSKVSDDMTVLVQYGSDKQEFFLKPVCERTEQFWHEKFGDIRTWAQSCADTVDIKGKWYISGGGGKMAFLEELLKEVVDVDVEKLRLPAYIESKDELAAALSLICLGYEKQREWDLRQSKNLFHSTVDVVKRLYKDYF